MKIVILILVLCALLVGCTKNDETVRLLEKQGYTNIVITGYKPFACGNDDDFATGFTATSPAGHPVSGVVCSGILKGSTIRFDD